MSAGGAAEPPITIVRIDERSQRFGSASSSGEDADPDGGHAGRDGDALARHEVEQRDGIEVRPPKTSFAPEATAANGRPHAAAWNIGTTGRTTSSLRDAHAVTAHDDQRVQHRRSMAVEYTLRVAGRARRCSRASPRRSRRAPATSKVSGSSAMSVLVVEEAVGQGSGARLLRSLRNDDHLAERRHVARGTSRGAAAARRRQKTTVSSACFAMYADLGRVEAQVQRVEDGAHARDGEVRLEVRLVVERERRHAVARLHAELAGQRVRELRRARAALGVRHPADGLVRQAR